MAQMGRRSQSGRTKEGSVNRINSVYCMTIDANQNRHMTLKNPYKLIVRIFLDLLMLSAIGNALTIFMIPGDLWSVKVVLTNCLFSIGIGYPAWKGMSYIVVVLERKLPWLQYPIKRLVSQVLSLTLFSGLIIFLGFTIWIKLSEGLDLESIFALVLPSLKVVYIFVFLSLLVGNAVLFFKNWKEATIQQEELKRAHLALQYQTLKDQVRPHFLFNSLSSLVTLINTDPEKATLFVHRLSDVYRYVLEQRENELVPVEEELKFLKDYVYLQQIRFGENLQIQYKLNLEPKQMVIPLSMQMLVENAIKHNEISADRPLTIEVLSTGQNHIIIKNNLQKKEVPEQSLGMGIENLKKRIEVFSKEPLQIFEESGAFIVRIPTIQT
jgi:two-component system LytT family sensor kinase